MKNESTTKMIEKRIKNIDTMADNCHRKSEMTEHFKQGPLLLSMTGFEGTSGMKERFRKLFKGWNVKEKLNIKMNIFRK